MRDREWPLNVIYAPDASASTRLPCLAYINVPLSTWCKIRYVSKFTAASRGSPCNSTAFLYKLLPHAYSKIIKILNTGSSCIFSYPQHRRQWTLSFLWWEASATLLSPLFPGAGGTFWMHCLSECKQRSAKQLTRCQMLGLKSDAEMISLQCC